jgi:hypothetical protein
MARAWIAGCRAGRFANHRPPDCCAATTLPRFGTPQRLSPIPVASTDENSPARTCASLHLRSCDAMAGRVILGKLSSYSADRTCRFLAFHHISSLRHRIPVYLDYYEEYHGWLLSQTLGAGCVCWAHAYAKEMAVQHEQRVRIQSFRP